MGRFARAASDSGATLSMAGIRSQQCIPAPAEIQRDLLQTTLQHEELAAQPLLSIALLEMDCHAKQHFVCFQVGHAGPFACLVVSTQR